MANAAHVVVIDGNPVDRAKASSALGSFYCVSAHEDYRRAAAAILSLHPAVVVVDEFVPPLGGREVLRRLQKVEALERQRIVVTSTNPASEFITLARSHGAHASLSKPYRRSDIINTVSSQANQAVERQWDTLAPHHRASLRATMDSFNAISDLLDQGQAVEFANVGDACSPLIEAVTRNDFNIILSAVKEHDNYSYVHSLRVATLLSLFGHTLGLKGRDLLTLSVGGLLHDIGKMKIPVSILNKPGALDDSERQIMKTHVDIAVEHLGNSPTIPSGVTAIAAQHHERLDGTGYPRGLEKSALNELARMAAIVDVFGALTDRRSYKAAMPPETALVIMRDEMAGHLDVHLVGLFRDVFMSVVTE